jgi:signal transduction histidine kinase
MLGVAKKLALVCTALLLLVAAVPRTVHAGSYGRDGYSGCNYQACGKGTTTTVLPSGLKVSVNLVDGQSIPQAGYTITITPLNGQGDSFAQADIFIGATAAGAALHPGDDGTVRWRWEPLNYPGTVVKVAVTDTDGQVSEQTFTVKVVAGPVPATAEAVDLTTDNGLVAAALHSLTTGAKHVIRKLPRPVVYGFPYALFLLLGVNISVLMLQIRREVQEYQMIRILVRRMRSLGEGKTVFLDLVSHYLRTPLTLIGGGIDMLPAGVDGASRLVGAHNQLRTQVEALIARSSAHQAEAVAQVVPHQRRHVWQQPGLYVPPLVAGLGAALFTWLTIETGGFTITRLNLAVQLAVFCLLALAFYLVCRHKLLARRDARYVREIAARERAAAQARDGLIAGIASALSGDLAAVERLVRPLPASPAATFVHRGLSQFQDIIAKCTLVAGLRGGHASKQFTRVRFGDVLQQASADLAAQARTRNVSIASPDADLMFSTQDSTLLALALHSLVDNAVAYGPPGGTVEVTAAAAADGLTIQVADAGKGIPEARQAGLFQPFFKAEGAKTFDHEGIGLSLYIDKLIMTYLGGDLRVQSRPGRTVFSLKLPTAAATSGRR